MTDAERARSLAADWADDSSWEPEIARQVMAHLTAVRSEATAAATRNALEMAAQVAEAQPYYSDIHVGMGQQWVKDEIARKIRALIGDKQ